MLRAKVLAAVVAAMIASSAAPAAAKIVVLDFTLNSGSWIHVNSAFSPYGLPIDPILEGSVDIDDTKSDATAFVGLDFTTGTKTWSLSNIQPTFSQPYFSGGLVVGFYLALDGLGIGTSNTAVIAEGPNTIYCNGCVSVQRRVGVAPVPEPTTWSLLLLGLGGAGALLRRRAQEGAA